MDFRHLCNSFSSRVRTKAFGVDMLDDMATSRRGAQDCDLVHTIPGAAADWNVVHNRTVHIMNSDINVRHPTL